MATIYANLIEMFLVWYRKTFHILVNTILNKRHSTVSCYRCIDINIVFCRHSVRHTYITVTYLVIFGYDKMPDEHNDLTLFIWDSYKTCNLHSTCKVHSYWMLNQVLHTVTSVLYWFKCCFAIMSTNLLVKIYLFFYIVWCYVKWLVSYLSQVLNHWTNNTEVLTTFHNSVYLDQDR